MERTRVVAWSAEMRRVHQRLADALTIARESIEAGEPVTPALDPLTYCWAFCAALDGHHGAEDDVLFPAIRAAHPEIDVVIGNLIRDHRMIGHLLAELRRAMSGGATAPDLLGHLDGIEAVMTTHFRYEEKRLLGLIDELDLKGVDTATVFGPLG